MMRRPVIRVMRSRPNYPPAQFYIVLVAGNGEVMLSSEMYPTHQNADRAARNLRRWMPLFKLELSDRV